MKIRDFWGPIFRIGIHNYGLHQVSALGCLRVFLESRKAISLYFLPSAPGLPCTQKTFTCACIMHGVVDDENNNQTENQEVVLSTLPRPHLERGKNGTMFISINPLHVQPNRFLKKYYIGRRVLEQAIVLPFSRFFRRLSSMQSDNSIQSAQQGIFFPQTQFCVLASVH